MRTLAARTCAAVSLAAALSACKKQPPPAPPAPTVQAVTIEAQSVPLTREFLSTVQGSTTAQIQPQVSGYIVEVNYREGTEVKVGQLLFTLDKRPFVAAVAKARGDHESAIAQLDKARADVKRYEPLVAQRAVSREQLDNARAAVLTQQGNLKATRGALETARLNLSWTEVRAPIAGLAGLAQTRVGTLVSPNQVLTVVSTLDPMRASFNVSQRDYLRYSEAMRNPNDPRFARERYFELVLVDGSVYQHRAREVIVNRQIDPTTGTLQVQALFPNPEKLLRPGMFGKVKVHAGMSEREPLVPEQAVSQLQGQYRVTVVDNEGRVQLRAIEVGSLVDHQYIVESGLRPGERVVVEGQQNAMPGMKVHVEPLAPSEIEKVSGRGRPTDAGS